VLPMRDDSDLIIIEKILQFTDLEDRDVLEVGCGDGRITALMAGRAGTLTAIEPDSEHMGRARKGVSGVAFHIASGEALPFSDASFDLVLFTLSLHHQRSDRALSEASRVLRDSGRILVVEPVNEGEIERICAVLHNEDRETLEAQRAIGESGLRIERSEVFHAPWVFESRDEVCRSIFRYYDMPYDAHRARRIADLVGERPEGYPIVLLDRMIIQSLAKM